MHSGPYMSFDDIYQKRSGDEKAIGFKVMYDQLRKHRAISTWLKGNDVKIIHLIRKNALKRVISDLVREKRGIAHSTKKLENIRITVNPSFLKREIDKDAAQRSRIADEFMHGPCIEMYYEDIFEDMQAAGDVLMDFLGLERSRIQESPLKKITSNKLQDVIENYAQLEETFRATKYEMYMKD